jgi:hypothetical protein
LARTFQIISEKHEWKSIDICPIILQIWMLIQFIIRVTLKLKECLSNLHFFWVCLFARFINGKLINRKVPVCLVDRLPKIKIWCMAKGFHKWCNFLNGKLQRFHTKLLFFVVLLGPRFLDIACPVSS